MNNMKNGIYYRNDGSNYGFYFYDSEQDKLVWLSKSKNSSDSNGITDFNAKSFYENQMVFVAPDLESFVQVIAPYRAEKPSVPVWAEYVAAKMK